MSPCSRAPPNVDNAKLFQNFIMDPGERGADLGLRRLRQRHHRQPQVPAAGLRQFAGAQPAGRVRRQPEFVPPCPPDVVEIYNKIWTNLRK